MEVAFRVVSALLAVSYVYPETANYIYDSNPNAGYVVAVGSIAGYAKKMPAHKKYFISNNIPKNMKLVNEHAVDSYFKILKSSSKSIPDQDRRFTQTDVSGQTESPSRQLKKTEKDIRREVESPPKIIEDNIRERENPTKNTNEILSHKREGYFRGNDNEYFEGNNMYERQSQNLDSLTHKGRTPSEETQTRSRASDRRPRPAQSIRQSAHASGVKDKILHKANVNNDRSYRKRHTIDKHKFRHEQRLEDAGDHANRSGRRYVPARIGNYDVGMGVRSRPYALFYRMNQEDFEQPELRADARSVEDLDDVYYKTGGGGGGGGVRPREPRKSVNYTAFRD